MLSNTITLLTSRYVISVRIYEIEYKYKLQIIFSELDKKLSYNIYIVINDIPENEQSLKFRSQLLVLLYVVNVSQVAI